MSDIKFTLIQTALYWENKEANLLMLGEKINSIKEPTHVIVLPEMFTTGFSMRAADLAEKMDGLSIGWMKKMAASKKSIITGSIIIEEEGKFFNRLIWMLPNGEYGYYDKRHLFAHGDEDQHYTPGKKRFIASVNGWKINPMICYDLRFPVWARQQYNDTGGYEYDVLIYIANWPNRRSQAWKTLLQARAIENQCYVVGVNRVGDDENGLHYSGNSMVVDALGKVLYEKDEDEDIVNVMLEKKPLLEVREKLPFWKEADHFLLIHPEEES